MPFPRYEKGQRPPQRRPADVQQQAARLSPHRDAPAFDPARHADLRREAERLGIETWPGADLDRLRQRVERARALRERNRLHAEWLELVKRDGRPTP